MLRSYSSPLAVGHRAVQSLWDGTVWAQEKIDGSQFSLGLRDGVLCCRSRNNDLSDLVGNPVGMFKLAVETAVRLSPGLREGWTYRCEFLSKPKHNTLAYDRVPKGNIILFDIDRGDQDYMDPVDLADHAVRLGLEAVPLFGCFTEKQGLDQLLPLLKRASILGKQTVEGIVLKNYDQFGQDGKTMMAKLVSKDFQESHASDWKQRHPSKQNIIEQLIERYGTEARWRKAVQHLREAGRLEGAPRDIGLLIKEIPEDILADSTEDIKEELFKAFIKDLRRGWTKGMPEWYKRQLAEEALQ